MKILVVGSGGREHALCWKLAQDAEVLAAPGNPGIAQVAQCFPVAASDHEGITRLCREHGVGLVVIGPEDPLISGLADLLRGEGISVFGPGAEGARLEGSKSFSKELMREAGVPSADFAVFTDPGEAHAYVDARESHVAVKADGAALGKGVIVCSTKAQAHEAIDAMLIQREFGPAGLTIVIEDRLFGAEFSLLTLCSDRGFLSLPVAQDYKRALDGDRGPNTGGMGTFSPVPWISPGLVKTTEATVVAPTLNALRDRGIAFRGVLFSGLMVVGARPMCLEYNVRFGDPETQSIMLRLGRGLPEALLACARGDEIPEIEVLPNAAVTVVVASGGYPGAYARGRPIEVGELPAGSVLFHAGTGLNEGHLVTAGGRVVGAAAAAPDLESARDLAYRAAQAVRFEGAFYRKDIAGEV